MEITTRTFKSNSSRALADRELQTALKRATTAFVEKRAVALETLEDFEPLRSYCGAVKAHTLEYLDSYLEELIGSIEARGGQVHFAGDAAEVNRIVTDLAVARGVETVVKSKSMVSEEVGLNEALEEAGVTPIETDLGEYILQLDEDVPSHIIGPAVHKTKEQIVRLFHDKLGTALDADVPALTAAARRVLREGFLGADMGITGVNFAVADTGTIVLVENEGNIRISTSRPRIHLAIMGLEKVIPRIKDLPAFMTLLPRSATGQKASSYVSLITGPRRDGEPEGPEEFHLLIVDNGRSEVLADPKLRDALRCIRCGACLNACPVYQRVGGHAYGWVYSGPIGAVLDPGLLGLEATVNLPQASSLCGACGEVCPVKIPLPDLLIEHRKRAVEWGLTPRPERLALGAFAFLAGKPAVWETGTRLARRGAGLVAKDGFLVGEWLPVMRAWLRERDFPQPAAVSFRERWRRGLKDES
ncbi:MAG: iron-sulfur cluster-binding protein [Trueperaceae bacterium]|nr:MAG: iron-sulfur cluster-binding protein [Trueperaceae bacterium]